MKILMITVNDPAGMAIAFSNAINRYTGYSCRLITTETRYNFGYEKDIHLPDITEDGFDEIRDLLSEADIIHFHILADENMELGPVRIKDFIKGKKLLHHHHGHPQFRANPEYYRAKYKKLGRKVVVSTPDLLQLVPEAEWQPNIVPVDDPLYLPVSSDDKKKKKCVVIAHSPTKRELKNTEDIIRVCELLQKRQSQKIKLDIIENTPHRECLLRKQKCDIFFDHMQGYFGVSSLEALSQGKPVIAGLDDWNIRHIKEFTGADSVPWQIARDEQGLEATLSRLLADRDLRQDIGHQARAFMEEYWHEQRPLERLLQVYNSL